MTVDHKINIIYNKLPSYYAARKTLYSNTGYVFNYIFNEHFNSIKDTSLRFLQKDIDIYPTYLPDIINISDAIDNPIVDGQQYEQFNGSLSEFIFQKPEKASEVVASSYDNSSPSTLYQIASVKNLSIPYLDKNINININSSNKLFITLESNNTIVNSIEEPVIVKVYGINKFGEHIVEEVPFLFPGTKLINKYLSVIESILIEPSNTEVDFSIEIKNYVSLNDKIIDNRIEYDNNNNKYYIRWRVNNNILYKDKIDNNSILFSFNNIITEEYYLDEVPEAFYVDDIYNYIWIYHGGEYISLYSKEIEINNLSKQLKLDTNKFCPLHIEFIENNKFKLKYIQGLIDYKIRKYRVSLFFENGNRYYYTDSSLIQDNNYNSDANIDPSTAWTTNPNADKAGFASPTYILPNTNDMYSIIIEVVTTGDIYSTYVENIRPKKKTKLNTIHINNTYPTDSVSIGADKDNRFIIFGYNDVTEDYHSLKLINFKFYNYFRLNDNNKLFNLYLGDISSIKDSLGAIISYNTNIIYTDFDDRMALCGFIRQNNEHIYDILESFEQLEKYSIGSDKKTLTLAINSLNRLKIDKAMHIISNNKYFSIDKDYNLYINSIFIENIKELSAADFSTLLSNNGITAHVYNNISSEYLIVPFKNYYTLYMLVKPKSKYYISLLPNETFAGIQFLSNDITYNVNKTDNSFIIDLEETDIYIPLYVIISYSNSILNYSNISVSKLKEHGTNVISSDSSLNLPPNLHEDK